MNEKCKLTTAKHLHWLTLAIKPFITFKLVTISSFRKQLRIQMAVMELFTSLTQTEKKPLLLSLDKKSFLTKYLHHHGP